MGGGLLPGSRKWRTCGREERTPWDWHPFFREERGLTKIFINGDCLRQILFSDTVFAQDDRKEESGGAVVCFRQAGGF